ncbi:DUF4062 domain-containing protein [Devosia sp.]|uniref:DUF4062 domain-containing protein n=1 Tax=Devosia sp. TaxID=1871048 RepID=UPI00273486E5|nr:DUF4062 domain-containing protein [Devosia sp.]MDP2781131.1 DUF4062 domain-containing protein [Devosia sp.]
MARRPTFFLSSTIYDFRDLRGAIKFSLEARGCRVLASEYNDFGGNLDQHSYEACLGNIEQADFFVLLIGSRVGGWFDESTKTSITQKEYQHAYDLHIQGKLRLVTFVRQEVWQLKEERRELERFLSTTAMEESERDIVARAPSRFASNAEFVSQFIAEVGRNVETGKAVKIGTAKPTGNWIHQFSNFRDIHDVLQPLAFTGMTSEDAAYRSALQGELLRVMSSLMSKRDDEVVDLGDLLEWALAKQRLTKDIRDQGYVDVDLTEWNLLSTIVLHCLGLQFETVVIDDALTSTVFLEYDANNGAYVQSAAYDALSNLWSTIRSFKSLATTENLSVIFATSPKSLDGRKSGTHRLKLEEVAAIHSLALRWINIIRLCKTLILHLQGQPFQAPTLMPFSPIVDFDAAIQAERVSVADLRAHLGI